MRHPGARRSLIVLLGLVALLVAVADLLRADSWLASLWSSLGDGPTRMERAVDQVHGTRSAPR